MRKLLVLLFAVIFIAAAGAWWLLIDARAPNEAPEFFSIEEFRSLVAADEGDGPATVRWLEVAHDKAPAWAVQAGRFGAPVEMSYNAVQLAWPGRSMVIGAAVDEEAFETMRQTPDGRFDERAYRILMASVGGADAVWITHEHFDHVMAIARHPRPQRLAETLRLNPPQLAALPAFIPDGRLPAELEGLEPVAVSRPTRIAPGVVVAPAAGHTEGSQVFYVQRADGQEYLLVGDIVWNMQNIADLSTRPRLLQYVVFEPDEVRTRVLEQVRALHDLMAAEPGLAIVPTHDRAHLRTLTADGLLVEGFQ